MSESAWLDWVKKCNFQSRVSHRFQLHITVALFGCRRSTSLWTSLFLVVCLCAEASFVRDTKLFIGYTMLHLDSLFIKIIIINIQINVGFSSHFSGRWQVASLLFLPLPVLPYDASVCRFIRLRLSQRHLLPNELNLKWSIDERRPFFLYTRRHSLMALIYTVCGNL